MADGIHARTDGFTSLAVVVGVIGIWLGFPLADPIVGLAISIAIFVLLWGTAREVGRRLLDGVDPSLVEQAEEAVRSVPGITDVEEVRLRWTGHRLNVGATVTSDPTMPVGRFHELEHQADRIIRSDCGHQPRSDQPLRSPHHHAGPFSSNQRPLVGDESRTCGDHADVFTPGTHALPAAAGRFDDPDCRCTESFRVQLR